jgi:oligopeptide/dipeptide ABC transporter ATP-binding protein
MNSVPKLGGNASRLTVIPGQVPKLGALPNGCRFHPRCPKARPDCARTPPGLVEVEPARWVRCPYWGD